MTADDPKQGEPVPPADADNRGVSAVEPAEGGDELPPPTPGSPKG